jgi:isoleucyl-tRNA synthetase
VEKYSLIEMVDLHRPEIDKVVLRCPKCGGEAYRISDVLDCWFESGSMHYAQWHYPFENLDKFENSFPADFIAEGIDQTRGWFYTLMVLSTALFDKPAFKNVIVNGIVLAEDGQKMSKRLKNYPEPNALVEKYGADSLRYYLLISPVMKAENLSFSERGVSEVLKRFILTLWNSYSFLVVNVNLSKCQDVVLDVVRLNRGSRKISRFSALAHDGERKSGSLLDKWILSEFNILIQEVSKHMESYDLAKASRSLWEFVDKLSNWYIRRSRKRFSSDDIEDRNFAFQTLYYVLVEYSKLIAPFMPFISEEIYRNLTGRESVHLENYPKVDKKLIDSELSRQMSFVRQVVALGLAARVKNGLKVRQPLNRFKIQIIPCAAMDGSNHTLRCDGGFKVIDDNLLELIKDELNVKMVEFVDEIREEKGWAIEEDASVKIALDLNVTEELKDEGIAREFVRHIQVMRKEAKYDRADVISVKCSFVQESKDIERVFGKWGDYIKKECLVESIEFDGEVVENDFDLVKELKVGNEKVKIGIKNV